MKVTVKDICALLEELAPPVLQESYDNSGLLVSCSDSEITKILLCLDSTENVVQEAIQKECQMIIAHHPIIWGGLKRITRKTNTERAIIKAIKSDISIYACHTNLDKVYQGVNQKFAEKLQLKNPKILCPEQNWLKKLVTFAPLADANKLREALFAAGAGNIGNYSECSFNMEGTGTFKAGKEARPHVGSIDTLHFENETRIEVVLPSWAEQNVLNALFSAHPYEEVAYYLQSLSNKHQQIGLGMIGELKKPMKEPEFLEFIKTALNLQSIRYQSYSEGTEIQTVAICGGSGHFLLKSAIAQGADAYITADVKYHEMQEAEGRLLYADIGHYESEIATTQIFAQEIRKKFANIALLFSENNINPIKYFL